MICLSKEESLLRKRKSMQHLRSNGNDQWRNTKRAKYNKGNYAQSRVDNHNRMQLWTVGDINKVLNRNKPDLELSVELGRSVQAIQVMRSKINKEKGETNVSAIQNQGNRGSDCNLNR